MTETPEPSETPGGKVMAKTFTAESIDFFVNHYNDRNILPPEVKKTNAARIKRSIKNFQFEHPPHAILPGSCYEFNVKIDRDEEYVFTRKKPKYEDGYEVAIRVPPAESLTFKLDKNRSKEFLNHISFTHHYLLQIYSRYHQEEDTEKKHIILPSKLGDMIKSIDSVFENGPESGELENLTSSYDSLQGFLKTRAHQFGIELQILRNDIAFANSIDSLPNHTPEYHPLFAIPRFKQEDWEPASLTSTLRQYLGDVAPNPHNHTYVVSILKKLVHDVLLHNHEQWIIDTTQITLSNDVKSLKRFYNLEPLRQEYESIVTKLAPIVDALEQQKRQAQAGVADSLTSASDILSTCKIVPSCSSIVRRSPKQLDLEVSLMIQKHKLTNVMEEEIKKEFPAYFAKNFSDNDKSSDISEAFS